MAQTQAAGWLGVPPDHPFGLQTLPYGSFTTCGPADRAAGRGRRSATGCST